MSRVTIDVRHEKVLTVIYCKASLTRKSRGILISVLKKQNIRLHCVRYINRSMQTLKKCNDVGHKQRKTFHIYFNCHIYMHDYKRSFCVNICMQKMRVLEYIFLRLSVHFNYIHVHMQYKWGKCIFSLLNISRPLNVWALLNVYENSS